MSQNPLPQFMTAQADGITLTLKVQPRASRNEVGRAAGNVLRVKVTAPPVDAAANKAVIDLLAEWLGCRRGAVQLIRGQTSRQKIVKIFGVAPEAVLDRLNRPA